MFKTIDIKKIICTCGEDKFYYYGSFVECKRCADQFRYNMGKVYKREYKSEETYGKWEEYKCLTLQR